MLTNIFFVSGQLRLTPRGSPPPRLRTSWRIINTIMAIMTTTSGIQTTRGTTRVEEGGDSGLHGSSYWESRWRHRQRFRWEKNIKYCGSVADPEPLIQILIFLPIRILDPKSSTLLVTILWKKVEKHFGQCCGSGPRIRILIFTHPGSQGQKSTGYWILDPQHC